jgi:LmbE family N-acetylglucosaminyl deacetylase
MDRLGPEKLLVVVAHQDDETIVAGGAMQQVSRSGGSVQVVYTTDGGAAQPTGSLQRTELVQRRRCEALSALVLAGVTEPFIRFLECESEATYLRPDSIAQLCDLLLRVIVGFQPDKILLGAFEGGNLEHDVTNFLVARAAARAGFPSLQIWEAPEYNRFYLREPIYQRLHRACRFPFAWPPRFLPGGADGEVLPMTAAEMATKQRMLECFESQAHVRLAERFSFPDRFRPLPRYDYAAGPFNPGESCRFRLSRFLRGSAAFPYSQRCFGPQEYRDLFQALESAVARCH